MKPTPFWRRYSRLLGPDPAADVKDELRFDLEAKIEDPVTQGWHPEAARQAARELNPKQPADEFRPLRTIVDRAYSPRRFFMLLVAAFAGLGLLLAALGIYGVISYSVARKTEEIGIRMALGASAGRVQRQVILNSLRLAAAGIAVGITASIASARLIASLLFATSPWDVTTYAGMVLLLVAVALISGFVPARRASSIDPMTALRRQ